MAGRLLVTGGTGFLGRRVVRRAASVGWTVEAPTRAEMDVSDPERVRTALLAARPDAVVHTAYARGGPDLIAVTAEGAGHVADAAADLGARLVHLSSDALFAGAHTAYVEADRPDPVTDYGWAKAGAEAKVAAAHPEAVIARTSLLIGGADDPGPQATLAGGGGPFFVDEWRCPVGADDVAAAVVRLLDEPITGTVHLVGPELLSRYQLAERLAPPGAPLRAGTQRDLPGRRPGRVELINTRLAWWAPSPVLRPRGRRGAPGGPAVDRAAGPRPGLR